MKKLSHFHFTEINSTNTWAKEHLKMISKDEITLFSAESQTAGRGRFKRKWIASPGKNINATFCCHVPLSTPYHHIPQVLALAGARLLEKYGHNPELKWPNDILIDGKKIAGILGETVVESDGVYVITGIGINVNMTREELDQIDRPVTSMCIDAKKNYSVEGVLVDLQEIFCPMLETFLTSGFSPFIEQFRSKHKKLKEVYIQDGDNKWEGFYENINDDGSLTIKLKTGSSKTFYAGEIFQGNKI